MPFTPFHLGPGAAFKAIGGRHFSFMAKGRAAILSAYTDFLGGVTIKDATLTQMGSEGAGDTHVAWGTFSVSLVDKKTNAESVMTGRYTDVQKMIGGKWLYIVDHASDDPAPAAK